MKKFYVFLAGMLFIASAFAQNLTIGPEDVRIIQSPEGGYHLYIKKKVGIASVLLTETTKDPGLKADNYAYRALEWNAVNGDEKRLLDGAFIPAEKNIWSLIDSTPQKETPVGEAFHVWIPWVISYGYDWSRHGEVQVLDGTYINIRAFSKPYADYTGSFKDNPFRLRVTQKAVAKALPSDSLYMKDTVAAFTSLAEKSSGKVQYAATSDEILPRIKEILTPAGGASLDLVFVIDATESMMDDVQKLREHVETVLQEVLPLYPSWRIGLVLYKDYFDDFLVKNASAFTPSLGVFHRALTSFRVQGGRDIPEAVYEGLDAALSYPWLPGSDRKIILIGDAPPHPKPRGRTTEASVSAMANGLGVSVNVIILPHGSTY